MASWLWRKTQRRIPGVWFPRQHPAQTWDYKGVRKHPETLDSRWGGWMGQISFRLKEEPRLLASCHPRWLISLYHWGSQSQFADYKASTSLLSGLFASRLRVLETQWCSKSKECSSKGWGIRSCFIHHRPLPRTVAILQKLAHQVLWPPRPWRRDDRLPKACTEPYLWKGSQVRACTGRSPSCRTSQILALSALLAPSLWAVHYPHLERSWPGHRPLLSDSRKAAFRSKPWAEVFWKMSKENEALFLKARKDSDFLTMLFSR